MKAIFRHILGICVAATEGFIKDDCFSKASLLTFYSLLSIVPILAVAFGIAKGFGFEQYLEAEITSTLIEQPEIAHQLISFAYSALEQAHGGVIAAAGVISLLWTSIQLLSGIERSLNEIWEVKTQRTYARQFSDYLAIVILCPIFLVLSGSLSVFAVTEVTKLSQEHILLQAVSPYILIVLRLFPFILMWILFSFIYIFMPNTTVQWKTALIAGIFAGSIYQFLAWVYVHFQIGVSSYGAIYGSFAAVPLFLAWLNLSWVTVLGGAELAYHMEISSAVYEGHYQLASKKLIALSIAGCCCEVFMSGKKPLTILQIVHETGVPLRVARYIAAELYDAGILARDQNGSYLPAKNPEEFKIKTIFDALEINEIKYSLKMSGPLLRYEMALKELDELTANAKENRNMKELVSQIPPESPA